MKYILLIFLASCMWANKPAKKPENTLKNQQKRMPIQNAEVLKRISFESEQEAGILDLRKNPINGQEISFKRPAEESSQMQEKANSYAERPLLRASPNNPTNNEQRYLQEERIAKGDPTSRETAALKPAQQAPSAQAFAEPRKPEILEITGNQSKQKLKNREDALIPPPSRGYGKFVISTSPSYIGGKLEEAKQILSKFGSVKEVREGEMFSLKLLPSAPLQTEDEARNLIDKIIQSSFFDVYIEKL